MKNHFLFTSFIAAAALFGSCTKDSLRGSGDKKTDIRVLGAFDVVHFSGIREAEIIKGDESKVELTGYASLVNNLEARVSNGNLYFYYPNYHNIKNDNVKIRIYTRQVNDLYQTGETKVKIGEGFAWDVLRIHQSGKSHLEIGGGTANRVTIDGSGQSKVFAKPLAAARIEMDMSGDSYGEVLVNNYLKVHASGRVRVKFWGAPATTDVQTSGEASVERQ